jgi:phage terminase small subunit
MNTSLIATPRRRQSVQAIQGRLPPIGWENLRKPEIVKAIRARKADLDAEYEHRVMGKYEVLSRLTEIALADLGDLLEKGEDGKPKGDVQSISLQTAKQQGKSHLIKRLKSTIITNGETDTQTEIVEVELYSAHDALRDLGRHHKLFTDNTVFTGTPTWKEIVERAMQGNDGSSDNPDAE